MTIQAMLAEFLETMGFAAMARDVATEQDQARLRTYARVVLKNLPADKRMDVHSRFVMLRLI